jgi:hypothetical protein
MPWSVANHVPRPGLCPREANVPPWCASRTDNRGIASANNYHLLRRMGVLRWGQPVFSAPLTLPAG